ncbi:uncharacterized protein LOC107645845 isoform X1 [Arachis ipaensis]|nr:uncharacterized protein LOC107645845 isoform X1 [Arachis ipaensis]XP_025662715.1 uncharacterized protein LOC112758304 isoform X1 [Arachis hypogaea]
MISRSDTNFTVSSFFTGHRGGSLSWKLWRKSYRNIIRVSKDLKHQMILHNLPLLCLLLKKMIELEKLSVVVTREYSQLKEIIYEQVTGFSARYNEIQESWENTQIGPEFPSKLDWLNTAQLQFCRDLKGKFYIVPILERILMILWRQH